VIAEADLRTALGPLSLASPVMPASGCFGPELATIVPLSSLGAVVTKTVFSARRSGNFPHRLTETASGMLNSVGIPSPGISVFRKEVLPRYQAIGVPVVVSIGGLRVEEYWRITEELCDVDIDAFEVNVSCPNLERGGRTIGTNPDQVGEVVSGVCARTDRPVFVKLTPNVTSVVDAARVAEAAGATALTVANTFLGLAVDFRARRPVLGNAMGGLSGPAIKPLALRLVWEASRSVSIPIVGCGGITSAVDVVEFLLAGASAVQVGTANFGRPDTMVSIIDELPETLALAGATSVAELVGQLVVGSDCLADHASDIRDVAEDEGPLAGRGAPFGQTREGLPMSKAADR
jgi:dihydroorotate dehydrogenase (NAD+) catalytic subunit